MAHLRAGQSKGAGTSISASFQFERPAMPAPSHARMPPMAPLSPWGKS